MKRREWLCAALALAGTLGLSTESDADVRVRRAVRWPRRRRFYRRRFRRVAFTRVVLGRTFWVVPVGLAVGWELMHRDRVVVVRETRVVVKDGQKTEVAVVEDSHGKTEEVEILREDNAENATELTGSAVPDDDTTTPTVPSQEAP